MKKGLRIAVIGSRGIPAAYGGFETFAEELTPRLVERGHEVTVYCRNGYTLDDTLDRFRGVRLVHTPAIKSRTLEQLSHELTSIVDSIRRRFDVYYFLGYRGAPFYIPLRASRRAVIVNTNGLEWRRRKWNRLGRTYLKMAEWIVAHVAADELVSDAQAIAAYFRRAHNRESAYLTNGAYVRSTDEMQPTALKEYGVTPGGYYLVACRIEPENNVDIIVREFARSGSKRELIIAGGMNYETPYWQQLQKLAQGSNIRFLGPVYGPMLVESLHLGAYGYLHGHEVGGTNPALLKAMGCGNISIALDTEFNVENAADTGRYWSKDPGSLAAQIKWADAHPDEVTQYGQRARARIAEHYTWDSVADNHDALFRRVALLKGIEVAPPLDRIGRAG